MATLATLLGRKELSCKKWYMPKPNPAAER